MKHPLRIASLVALLALCAAPVLACTLQGHVTCEGDGSPMAGVTIQASAPALDPPFLGSAVTDASGFYSIELLAVPASYAVTALVAAGDHVATPASGSYQVQLAGTEGEVIRDWVIASPTCLPTPGKCWLTGGGAKTVAGNGDRHSFGGNVNPGCSPTAGDGGNWNDLDHTAGLHFQGRAITVLQCGNIEGIPPGSSSPKTPFNYIEFTGTGTLKGVGGNKLDRSDVFFWAHYEDRGEPGNEDRYFLRVYGNPADPVGSTLMLVDGDGVSGTMDPTVISHGNLQLHISGCSKHGTPVTPGVARMEQSTHTPASWGQVKIIYR